MLRSRAVLELENLALRHQIGVLRRSAAKRSKLTSGDLVGSRTGAVRRRFGLAVAPRFLWECLNIQTVSRSPAPAASNPSCRFPAMGLPAGFRSRIM